MRSSLPFPTLPLRPIKTPIDQANDSERLTELFSDELEQAYGFGLPRYDAVDGELPLKLISPSSSKRTNTTGQSVNALISADIKTDIM